LPLLFEPFGSIAIALLLLVLLVSLFNFQGASSRL
jgi:hypothetical protein